MSAPGRRAAICAAAAFAAMLGASPPGEAHKEGPSRYTFSDDVFPVLRARCSQCHMRGGIAPMALMTYDEAVPWAESLRLELMAGHMPPWSARTSMGRIRHAQGLTAHELNVLLTWASGDTPPGSTDRAPAPVTHEATWKLGDPDLALPLPTSTLDAATAQRTASFTLSAPAGETWLRAVDFRPGTAAIVRRATVATREGQVLLQWQPGDEPVALPAGAAFRLPAATELTVTVHYRKTFGHEGTTMADQSVVGLYRAAGTPAAVVVRTLAEGATVIEAPLRVLAVSPGAGLADGEVRIDATRPGEQPLTLIAFRARSEWARRYWFEQPVTLGRGTRLETAAPSGEPVDLLVLRLPDE